VIPSRWSGFTAVRRFRGVTYRIAIQRSGPGNNVALRVDGVAVPGDIVPPPADGRTEVLVEATLS